MSTVAINAARTRRNSVVLWLTGIGLASAAWHAGRPIIVQLMATLVWGDDGRHGLVTAAAQARWPSIDYGPYPHVRLVGKRAAPSVAIWERGGSRQSTGATWWMGAWSDSALAKLCFREHWTTYGGIFRNECGGVDQAFLDWRDGGRSLALIRRCDDQFQLLALVLSNIHADISSMTVMKWMTGADGEIQGCEFWEQTFGMRAPTAVPQAASAPAGPPLPSLARLRLARGDDGRFRVEGTFPPHFQVWLPAPGQELRFTPDRAVEDSLEEWFGPDAVAGRRSD